MNVRMWIVGLTVAALSAIPGCEKKSADAGAQSGTDRTAANARTSARCPHEIKREKCPFCNPALVESDGFCGEHGVAEALCVLCRPYLKAAFRAKGDWCADHSVPDSQCIRCHPELKANIMPGEHGADTPSPATATADPTRCDHAIARAQCPFCSPSLIESEGFCDGHNVAEALCVKCRPFLEAAFKAKGDWCAEHNTPESQCAECSPDLKDTPPGKD